MPIADGLEAKCALDPQACKQIAEADAAKVAKPPKKKKLTFQEHEKLRMEKSLLATMGREGPPEPQWATAAALPWGLGRPQKGHEWPGASAERPS